MERIEKVLGTNGYLKRNLSANGTDTCVEVARLPHAVATRDSTDPDGPRHHFTVTEMATLFEEIRRGRYDLS